MVNRSIKKAHIYEDDSEPYDVRDENYMSSDNEERAGYCEVCDREFETVELLDRHTESHKICGVDGCTFSAHPKLVEKHINMQHCTGLYHRMKNLSTPEDIEKWIAERKKKYPTKTNMEQKIAEDTAKRKRGEVIEEKKSFDKSKHTRRTTHEKNRRVRKRKTQGSRAETELPPTEYYRGLRPFAGTAAFRRAESEDEEEEQEMDTEAKRLESPEETTTDLTAPDLSGNISDDEEEPMNSLKLSTPASGSTATEPAKSGQSCLLSLVADYGSESDDDGPDEIAVKKLRMDPPAEEDLNKTPEVSPAKPKNSTDDEGPEEFPIKRESSDFPIEADSHQAPEISIAELANESQVNVRDNSRSENTRHLKATKPRPVQPQRRRPNDRSPRKTPNGRYGDKKRLMLLQRLLSRSIQHERNIICQCIKYIADNDFFQ